MKSLAISFPISAQQVADLCKQYDIAFLGVFGSYARGDYDNQSDIDLLVRFSKQKSLLDLVRIERLFATQLGKSVDLITEASVSPYLKDRIQSEVQPLYEAA